MKYLRDPFQDVTVSTYSTRGTGVPQVVEDPLCQLSQLYL